jgi:hypothetical protein
VEVARFFTTRASRVVSEIQTAEALEDPLESTHLPCQLLSVGLVEETKTANRVVGLEAGLPFSAFAKLRVEVVAPDKIGAPGIAAAV